MRRRLGQVKRELRAFFRARFVTDKGAIAAGAVDVGACAQGPGRILLSDAVIATVNETMQCYEMGVNDDYPLNMVLGNDLKMLIERTVVDCTLNEAYLDDEGRVNIGLLFG